MILSESAFYVTGGTLTAGAPSYIERQADTELALGLSAGEFCYVLTSRQMGKSSLMVHTAHRLRQDGIAIAVLDLTALGQNLSAEQWYYGLLGTIGEQLELRRELRRYWAEHALLGPVQRWMSALREVVLPHFPGGLVIFVDEIDAVRSLSFSTDEFFAAIRECYNRRTQDPGLGRLGFCLLGVASPSDLIRDPRNTPFNIGRRIELHDFTPEEAAPLAHGLAGRAGNVLALLARVLYWTGGHPYLTQRLCKAVAEAPVAARPADVDRLCRELFLAPGARQRDDNLLFVGERLLRNSGDVAGVLDQYGKIREGRPVRPDDTDPQLEVLHLSGIVRLAADEPPRPWQAPLLEVRNRIYQAVFDQQWIQAHLPGAERRRQQAAFRLGLLRASAVAAVVLLIVTLLAGAARSNERKASRLATRLQLALSQREAALHQREAAVRKLESTLQRLQNALDYARKQHARATTLRGKADISRAAAESARRKAEQQRQVAVAHKATAERERRKAIQAEHAAEVQRDRARERLVRMHVADGWRLADSGDLAGALVWFTEALKLEAGNPAREREHRLRIGSLLRAFPQPVHEWRCSAAIRDVQFSPDARKVFISAQDNTARLWNAETGEPLGPVLRGLVVVRQVVFSGEQCRALCLDHQRGRIWDAVSGSCVMAGPLHSSQADSAAFDRSGHRVITAGDDHQARVWDAATGRLLSGPLPHGANVWEAALSPDDRRAATLDSDGQLRIWNLEAGRLVGTPVRIGAADWLEFSPDGRRLLVAGAAHNHWARVWDTTTGRLALPTLAHSAHVCAARFSPDGRSIATAGADGAARIWDAATGRLLCPPLRHGSAVRDVRFTTDGAFVVTASMDKTARVWSAATGAPVTPPLPQFGGVTCAEVSPDGRWALAGGQDGTVRLWDTAHCDPAGWPVPSRRAKGAWVSPDGRRLATLAEAGTLRLWDAANGAPTTFPIPISLRPGVSTLTFDARWERFLADNGNGQGWLFDLQGRRLSGTLSHLGGLVECVAFSPAGDRVATGGQGQDIRIWVTRTGERLSPLAGCRGAVTDLCFSPDGKRIVGASRDHTARLWDVATGRPLALPLEHGDEVRDAEFSPDGRLVVTASSDRTARVWDSRTGRPVTGPLQHDAPVVSAHFSPDGLRVVTASEDGTARVWQAVSTPRTARPVTPPLRHASSVLAAVFSPDGRWVATGSGDCTSRLWSASTGEPLTLPLSLGQPVTCLAFSPDGAALTAASPDGTVQRWEIVPDRRPVAVLQAAVCSLVKRRIDAASALVSVDPDRPSVEAPGSRAFFPGRSGPGRSGSSPAAVAAWHRRDALQCAEEGQWSTAAAHLTVLIESSPGEADLYQRRAEAYSEAGAWGPAAADWLKAAELDPSNHLHLYRAALSQLAAGDLTAYGRTCAAMLDRYEASANVRGEVISVWSCGLGPPCTADPDRPVRLCRKLLAQEPQNQDWLQNLGAVLYRAGRSEEALQALKAGLGEAQPEPQTRLLHALIRARLGDLPQAREEVARAQAVVEESSTYGDLSWADRAEIDVLLREAQRITDFTARREAPAKTCP